MQQRVCDRCEKTLQDYGYYAGTIEQNSLFMFCGKKYKFDLCNDCQKDFMKFLSGSKKTERLDIQEKE